MEEDFVYNMKRLFGRFESEENIASIARHKLLHAIQELLEDDQIWCKSLEEATLWASTQSL